MNDKEKLIPKTPPRVLFPPDIEYARAINKPMIHNVNVLIKNRGYATSLGHPEMLSPTQNFLHQQVYCRPLRDRQFSCAR